MAERERRFTLAGIVIVGVAAVIAAIAMDSDILPSVLLELGAGLLLAAFVFVTERRLEEKVAERVVHQITAHGAARSSGSARFE